MVLKPPLSQRLEVRLRRLPSVLLAALCAIVAFAACAAPASTLKPLPTPTESAVPAKLLDVIEVRETRA